MTEESKVDRLAEDPHMKVEEMMGCEPSFVSQSNCSVFHYNLDQRPLQEVREGERRREGDTVY